MIDSFRELLFTLSGGYWEQLKIIINLVCACLCGVGIFIVFYITHRKISVSRGFAFTLILLAPVSAMVAVIISYDIVIAVGMLGALSIIRFRHSMKESRNLVFVFWSVTAGLACGLSFFEITVSACIIIAVLALTIDYITRRGYSGTLSIKMTGNAERVEEILDGYAISYELKYTGMAGKTDKAETTDVLYELKYKKKNKKIVNIDLCKNIMQLGDVTSVSFVEL